MQVGEQHLAAAQHRALARLRLLDLDDHLAPARRPLPRVATTLRAARLVLRVVDADAVAGAALDDDLVARARQLPDAGRHEADPVFVDLDLARNADRIEASPEGGWWIEPRRLSKITGRLGAPLR